MTFICASCRRLGGVQPSCRACATVGIAVATFRVPEPMFVSVAPEEPKPYTQTKYRIRAINDPLRSEGEWHQNIIPTNSFPILEHRFHDEPPDYPYFNDFTLSHEERSYMQTQVDTECDIVSEWVNDIFDLMDHGQALPITRKRA